MPLNQSDMDELDQMFETGYDFLNMITRRLAFRPAIDVEEDAQEVTIRSNLPGVKKEDIVLEAAPDSISISGELPCPSPSKFLQYQATRYERKCGPFKRIIELPNGVQTDDIVAKYNNGVLEVKIPKSKESKESSRIEINDID